MKEENKKEIKKGILTGAGTAAGAVIGAVVENTINAADVEDKNIKEAVIVEAIAEDLDEIHGVDDSTIETNSVASETIVSETTTHIQHPERKPSHQNVEIPNSQTSEEEDEPFVEEVTVIEAETELEVAVEEESDLDEDIMVVSVAPEQLEDEETNVSDETIPTTEIETVSEDDDLAPDYADMKDNDLSEGGSMITTLDMPDYVNDANIDSFTDNV